MELPTKDGGMVYIRKCGKPEFHQRAIYDLLQIPHIPVKPVKSEIKHPISGEP